MCGPGQDSIWLSKPFALDIDVPDAGVTVKNFICLSQSLEFLFWLHSPASRQYFLVQLFKENFPIFQPCLFYLFTETFWLINPDNVDEEFYSNRYKLVKFCHHNIIVLFILY